MRFLLHFTTLVAWALWLGGSVATMLIGLHFFKWLPHDVAGPAANDMFHSFGHFELVLSAITVIASGALIVAQPSKWLLLILGLFILAAGMTIAFTLGFIPLMDALIEQGRQTSHEFIRLHIKSMIAMSIQVILLLGCGAILIPMLGAAKNDESTELDSDLEQENFRTAR